MTWTKRVRKISDPVFHPRLEVAMGTGGSRITLKTESGSLLSCALHFFGVIAEKKRLTSGAKPI